MASTQLLVPCDGDCSQTRPVSLSKTAMSPNRGRTTNLSGPLKITFSHVVPGSAIASRAKTTKTTRATRLEYTLFIEVLLSFSVLLRSPCNPRPLMAADRGSGGPSPLGHTIEISLLIDFSLLNTKARLARERSGSKGMSTPCCLTIVGRHCSGSKRVYTKCCSVRASGEDGFELLYPLEFRMWRAG